MWQSLKKWLAGGRAPAMPEAGDAPSEGAGAPGEHFEEAKLIWREFVPPAGQSETIQGELLRAVEKLRDEAIRNGNCNWDEGFEILLFYLERHLPDPEVFPPGVCREAREILARLHDFEDPLLEDEPYDWLGDRVVELYRHYGSRPHAHDPALRR